MCLDPLLPCPSGGVLPWGITNCGVWPSWYALMCLGVLVLWVQMEMLDGRGYWGIDYIGFKKY